jgi:hypothetical protein
MNGRDFYTRIDEHPDLFWCGNRNDEVFIGHKPSGHKYKLHIDAILSETWEDLEAVLTGKRTARILSHVTRIVGYFSQIQNWNRSKLAELKDRQKGSYALPEGVKQ